LSYKIANQAKFVSIGNRDGFLLLKGVLAQIRKQKGEIKMSETWNKRERERNKRQKKMEKLERRQEKKLADKGSHDLESMLAYVDENGNLSSKPMDPNKIPKA
jgi:hypothetical protein